MDNRFIRAEEVAKELDVSKPYAYKRIRQLKQVAADYDALCRGYGSDRVEEQVRAIREREEEQKRQRRIQRQRHSIGAR